MSCTPNLGHRPPVRRVKVTVVVTLVVMSGGWLVLDTYTPVISNALQYPEYKNNTVRNNTPDQIIDPDVIETCPLGVRRRHLLDMCRTWPQVKEMSSAKGVITDPARQLLYCEVSKVACTKMKTIWELANTNWTHISPVLAHDFNKLKAAGLSYRHSFQLDNTTSQYSKFMVVRHPIDRLLSGYRNILNYNGNGPYYAIKPMIDRFHLNNIQELTFNMFVQAIVDEKFRSYNDPHWIPYSLTCNPCYMKYDYILRTETMQAGPEMVRVLDRLQYNTSAMAGLVNKGQTSLGEQQTRDGTFRINRAYRTLLQSVPQATLRKLHHRYRDDFLLFGYTFDIEDYSFSCGINHNGKVCC